MVQVMNKYETIFIINPELSEEEIQGVIERFKSLIESAGEVESVDEWGKRRLAYPINKMSEGYYVLINFAANPSFLQELERVYRIHDAIMRHIIVKKD